jgi:hypothetical protein
MRPLGGNAVPAEQAPRIGACTKKPAGLNEKALIPFRTRSSFSRSASRLAQMVIAEHAHRWHVAPVSQRFEDCRRLQKLLTLNHGLFVKTN